jgi:hypothetical protein
LRALGIGLPYFEDVPAELYRDGGVDFLEITPEVFCRERRGGDRRGRGDLTRTTVDGGCDNRT